MDNPHVMSRYATELDCLRQRDAWYVGRVDRLQADNADANQRINALEATLRKSRNTLEEAMPYCEGAQWSPSMARDCNTMIEEIDEVLK
jgi:hypothetical protein